MGRKPIFQQVAQTLRMRICNGAMAVGDALPAERTLAAELGVSRLTLRKALDVIAGDGLVARKPGRGVFVAKATPAGRAKTVLYIGETQEHVYRDIHAHLCAEGQARGLSVIAFTPTGQDADIGRLRALAEDAVAVICDTRSWQTIHARYAPYLGYRSALREAGIEEEMVLATPRTPGEEWREYDFEAARLFLARASERPTAFVCGGDFRAGPLIRAASESGLRVPRDLSVIGMGNTPWAEWLTPPLTSVALGEAELARLALLLAGEPEMPGDVIFRVTPRLVERRSTQPPPNKKGFR